MDETDAAREFPRPLDPVEITGQEFAILRQGQAVAILGPAAKTNGRQVKSVLLDHPADPYWLDEIRELRASVGNG